MAGEPKPAQAIRPEEWVRLLFDSMLGRAPRPQELGRWASRLQNGLPLADFILNVVQSKEHAERHRVRPSHPPGHYYSPVVDPLEAVKRVRFGEPVAPHRLKGLRYPVEAIVAFWHAHRDLILQTAFPQHKTSGVRYYWHNHIFPASDAAILRAIMLRSKPRRIVEVGSGFSTACMLDTLDEGRLTQLEFTCIEPYPERLYGLLWEEDRARVRIIDQPVQEVPLELFAGLEDGDILFIDSTHVLKTGSDVHHELFEILPSLQAGVLIHFHDIHYPFEYPRGWICDIGRSWNEVYALRAFLMYNDTFQIVFHGSYFAAWHAELVHEARRLFARSPGGSIWLRKKA
jgi:predicted O-methyltransferase YrrM